MSEPVESSYEQPPEKYTDWYGFDTENDPTGKVTLTALVHESGERWVWREAGRFAEWCDRQVGTRPVVICHNLEYDLVNEFGTENYAKFALNYLKGRLISARYKNVSFLDSFNHFRMSLKEIGKSIGIEKKDFDINDEEYVSTDAWICLKVMTGARDYIAGLGGRMGATSGSSAVSVWRFMTDDEYLTGPIDTPWLRQGYYGGRTEIFRPHTTGDIRGYDINSMYPFCMKNEFPEYLMDDPKLAKGKGMGEVTIAIPLDTYVAPLPWRTPNEELWYPVGVIRGVWTYDEIRTAESLGARILKVHRASGCNSQIRPFNQFVDTLYAKRKESTNPAERLFLKVLMNSLYGKLASRSEVTRTVSRFNLVKSKNQRIEEVKWINYHRGLLDYKTPQQPYVNVCWGAMVTAYSRLLLFKYLRDVPPEQLIYCDTDSMYCKDYELTESNELGGMKLEKRARLMNIVQPKAYQIDDFFRAKGVPRPKYDEKGNIVIDYARQYIEDGFTEFMAPIRFRKSLNSKQGKANQWVPHSKGRKSAYRAKQLSGDRYFPPVIGDQQELDFLPVTASGKSTTKKRK